MKRDAVGQVVTPCEKRESLLDEFERSSLSGAEFERLTGVKYQTFAGWVQRRRHACGEYGVRTSMFLPARLLAHVAISHYELPLPYYRIERMSGREGLELSRQTQCTWMGMAARSASLVVQQVEREVFADGYVHIAKTPVK